MVESQYCQKFVCFIEIAQEINGRESILSKICITANVQENFISAKRAEI
jgi:hypothetical protein